MNRYLMTTTSLLAGAVLVLGGAVVASAATPTAPAATPVTTTSVTAAPTSTRCTFGEHLVSAFRALPKAMRDDLKSARAETPGPQRRMDLQAIRTKALNGGYGADVEAKVKFLQSHRGDIQGVRPLPAELKADLKTLHAEKGRSAKVAEANTIADKALAGDYGDKVETLAKSVKASDAWQDCSPAASGS
jgi:plasmid stability protein